MLDEILFKKSSLAAASRSLDAAMLRGRVIANNVANINTPGYRRVEVKFEEQLRLALDRTRLKGARTSDKHFQIGRKDLSDVHAEAYRPVDHSLPSGVNNIDIDTEMAKLAENQISYNFGLRFVRGAYRKLNAAIQGKSMPNQ